MPIEPQMLSLTCGEWYCVNVVGYVIGFEKYEYVRLNWFLSLFSVVTNRTWWLRRGKTSCGD